MTQEPTFADLLDDYMDERDYVFAKQEDIDKTRKALNDFINTLGGKQ